MDKEELKDIYAQSFPTLKEGEIIKGKIIRHVGNVVLVDMGLKSEGILPMDEFNCPEDAVDGKEIWVYLEALEDKEGFPVISKKKADFQLAWDTIRQKAESAEGVPATIRKKVKGGLAVEVMGLDAFLPGSQIDIRPVSNVDALVGKTFDVKILSVNWFKKNIVVSRRTLLEEQAKKVRQEAFSQINVGDLVEGTVKTITDFGAFIDIGGIDALLHISDMAWNKVVHPKEFVNPGDKIKVKILTADPESFRVTVGLKQLTPHPWDGIEEKYPIGSRINGRVTTLAEYGAFIELEKGVEGLIHVSEMSWTKMIHHPSQILKIGETIETVVLSIDKENRRISLGLKQTTPDPWSLIEEKYNVGQKVTGRIRSLKDFGAFVEIEEGIEGLIHNSDLSWTTKVKHPREVVKKDQRIETIILEIDKENRRIGLGLKQTKEDPYYRFTKEYKEGDAVKARIIDLPKPGIVVSLPHNIEGFVPLGQLARGARKTKDKYKIGEEIELVIAKIDLERRHIALSEKMLYPSAEEEIPAEPKPKKRGRRKEKEFEKEEDIDRFTLEDHLK